MNPKVKLFQLTLNSYDNSVGLTGDAEGTPEDTLEFELKIKCSWDPKKSKEQLAQFVNPEDRYRNYQGSLISLFCHS